MARQYCKEELGILLCMNENREQMGQLVHCKSVTKKKPSMNDLQLLLLEKNAYCESRIFKGNTNNYLHHLILDSSLLNFSSLQASFLKFK